MTDRALVSPPRSYTRIFACIALLSITAACASPSTSTLSGGVSQAYNSTGVIDVPSYNRSIFSSTNF